jgi:hypothetical protein
MLAIGLFAPAIASSQVSGSYEFSTNWFDLPSDVEIGQPMAISSDGVGSLFLLRRMAETPIVVLRTDGSFVRGWGRGMFTGAHSIFVDRYGFVWATDNADNVVYKFSKEGGLLLTLGRRGVAGDNASPELFDGPSGVFVDADGVIYVSDGYRNSRIVKFDESGRFLQIIGGVKGSGPGELDLAHAVVVDSRSRVIVADRNNARIQVFNADGSFAEEWADLGIEEPSGLYITSNDTVYTNDAATGVILAIKDGRVVERIDGAGGRPHLITQDETGALYLADAQSVEFERIRKR